MKTHLQKYAELVVAQLLSIPYEEVDAATAAFEAGTYESKDLHGIDIIAIMELVELIMTMVMELIDKCPQNDQAVREAIKAPNLWQRVRFKRIVRDACRDCVNVRWQSVANDLAYEMIAAAAASENEDIDAVVDQVRNADNMLI